MPNLLLDPRPLTHYRDYRYLWAGMIGTAVSTHVSTLTVSLQVYDLTGSTFNVGLVGLFALVPLLCLGLYGGAIVDAHDRRRVIVLSTCGMVVVGTCFVIQAALDNPKVGILYGLVAAQNGLFAISNPARHAIIPRILPAEVLPAANALGNLSSNIGLTLGPLLGAVMVSQVSYAAAYAVQAVFLSVAVVSLLQLPSVPPTSQSRPAGLSSILEGLTFLRTRNNIRMTFLADLCVTVLAMPRVLFPALAAGVVGGGAGTVGILLMSLAIGSIGAGIFSGPLGSVRRHGLAVASATVVWGVSVCVFGVLVLLDPWDQADGWNWMLVSCAGLMLVCGAADTVSSVFRTTMLQSAVPDHLRGRLQGLFVVIVAGGPRLGDMVMGTNTEWLAEGAAALLGGAACVTVMVALCLRHRPFVHYDARHPVP